MKNFSWAGAVALMLATSIGLSIAAAVVISAWHGQPIDQQFATMLSTAIGAMIGVIATFMGRPRIPPGNGGGGGN